MEALVSSPCSVHAKAIELGKQALKMTTAAGSGHPTSALSLAHIVVELMYRQMRYDPRDPWNPHNDRLVLSEGHAVPIVYAAYADLGGAVGHDRANPRYLTNDDLANLRELDSILDGHPNPAEGFPFFDATTGSLGQGLSVGAGLALGARLDGIDKRIFVLMGDGEAREGQVWEAADFIADHRLTSVCAVFSCNGHGQADAVSPQQSPQRLAAKLEAFSWDVVTLDGHDPGALAKAFAAALNQEAKALQEAGATLIQFNEPAILQHKKEFEQFSDLCRSLVDGITVETSLYLYYGDAEGIYPQILDLPFQLIGLDFVMGGKNEALLQSAPFTKKLGLGIIDARNTKLESVDEIAERIRSLAAGLASDQIHVSPSAGLEFLPREVAQEKLRRLAQGVRQAEAVLV